MTDPTIARIVADMDSELAELSRLHMAYEKIVDDHIVEAEEIIDAALELSAAVGRLLVTRGYEGRI